MRLIKVDTLEMQEFLEPNIPPYAILSHRWGADDEEVSFSDMTRGMTQKAGMAKLKGCCIQAEKDNIDYIWIDTCCINKESSKELDEAINSMFQWYRRASVCYTYMSDVPDSDYVWSPKSKFHSSSWFRRGWTLQELLAPVELRFYNQEWNFIGTKADLSSEIETITGIHRKFLLGWIDFHQASVAQRMSWAAKRETKREEDIAYCLLGIFNVSMSMIYGEKEKAFERLQLKILEQTTDDSIFAWGFTGTEITEQTVIASEAISAGIFASSPRDFACCGHVVPHTQSSKPSSTFTVSGGYVHTSLTLRRIEDNTSYAMLNCCSEDNDRHILAMPLLSTSCANEYLRPQNYRPILVRKSSVEGLTQNIQIRVDRQVHPVVKSGTSVWLHVEGYHKLDLKLTETHPPLTWERSRALFANKDNKSSSTSTQLLRFRSDVPGSHDLIVVIELSSSDGTPNIRSYILQAFPDMDLKDVGKSLEFLCPESREVNAVDNGVMEVTLVLTQQTVPQGVVYLVSLGGTNKVPSFSNKLPEITTAKLKYDFMVSLKQEQLAGLADHPVLKDIAALQDCLVSAEAKMQAIEEEERALTDRKRSVRKDIENLTDRIAAQESQIRGRLASYTRFRRDRLMFQSILDGETAYSPGNSKTELWCMLEKGEVAQGPANWFERIIQRQQDRALSEKYYSWPVRAGQKGQDLAPLLWATENSKADIADLLLEKGSDIEVKDKQGCTALWISAFYGDARLIEILLKHGAQLESKNEHYSTPLFCAAAKGHLDTVALLFGKGADIEAKSSSGATPLDAAAYNGHEDVTGLLLEKGADMESKDVDGNTPLAVAACTEHTKTATKLLGNGADIETRNINQETPLTLAAIYGDLEMARLLLTNHAYLETRDKAQRTPLAWAIRMGNGKVASLLLLNGADIEATDDLERTPLAQAVGQKNEAMVKLLLERGADVENRDVDGRTPLALAAIDGLETIVQLFIEQEANVNSRDLDKVTPLWYAASFGHTSVVSMLFDAGARIDVKGRTKFTPLMVAEENGHRETVRLLKFCYRKAQRNIARIL